MNDDEAGRWQQAIYKRCCDVVAGLRKTTIIDGAGLDSGDPLDLTLAEIGQAFNCLRDEIYLLANERDEARAELAHARHSIGEACELNREMARQLELLMERSEP